jgi:phytoene dehydrogenase-like protein
VQSLIIIGAGIAGLSCGCYAAMNGFSPIILEAHDLPGGVCTAWTRKGYTFDACIHWLMGSSARSPMNKLWRELGVVPPQGFYDPEEYCRYENGGREVCLFTDNQRLKAHLLEVAPEDAALVEELCAAIDRLGVMEMPIDDPWTISGFRQYLRLLPIVGTFRKYGRMPIGDLVGRFKNPFAREALGALFAIPEAPAAAFLMGLATQSKKNAGYPMGGSLAFAQAMERRYLGLGGKLEYKARVVEILVEGSRAVGVRLTDGRELRADFVVSAADGHATIFEMLGGRFIDEGIREMYSGGMPLFDPLVQVSLGLRRRLDTAPILLFPMDEPLQVGKVRHDRLGLRNLAHDPSLAPPNHSTVTVSWRTDYESWAELAMNRPEYLAEKSRIAEATVACLDRRWPGLAADVAVVDVATPMTWVRYTSNWRSSYEGWFMTTKTMDRVLSGGLPKRLPGLEGFAMIGQWTAIGGGLPPAAKDGRDLVKSLCRKERRAFRTSESGG